MSYEQRDNSGSLFKNDRRNGDNAPNSKGKAMIGGAMYYVSGWTRRTKAGEPWVSLAFTPVSDGNGTARKSSEADFDDDLPF